MTEPIAQEPDTQAAPRNEGPGGRIGRFKLLQQIGEGGFGAVFEAEQEHPVRRRVALKVIKLGMDTHEVIARFEAERQALAMMDHPHIARVLDAGATESGRPYFVMELVQGEPIASYCDRHNLPIIERLQLFEQVCQAVQHAHTKGIIHRDLKPSNVLVSTQEDRPFAKVIDFGIAKATSGRLTDKTLFTDRHQMIGTPLYMSPEQAEGSADIDTRTDIYSLGVMLYELLTGTTPFASATLRTAGYAEIQRIIRDVEPARPSARLVDVNSAIIEVANHRRTEPRKLARLVRGELDWIVMKAIEKERARRYETASALALDVHRYLLGQPVLAAPPSTLYRLRKFIRRNQVAVAAVTMLTVALLVGVVGFAYQARIAQTHAAELEQVSRFQADMLGQVDPTEAGKLLTEDVNARFAAALAEDGGAQSEHVAKIATFARQWQLVNATDTARELIDRSILKPAVAAINQQFRDQPIVDATLRQVLADRYLEMGLYDAALPLQAQALATRRRVLGATHPDTLTSLSSQGRLLQEQGKLSEAEPYFREALAQRRRVLGAADPDTLASIGNMGTLLQDQGKLHAAEPYFREVLEQSRRVLGEQHPDTLTAINNMGRLLQDQGQLSAAEPYFREALEKKRRVLGEEHQDTLASIINMGRLLQLQGDLNAAEPYYREALEKSRRLLGDEHPDTLTSLNNMGRLLQDQGKLSAAEPYLREALEKFRRVLGAAHPYTLISISNLGSLRVAQGRHAEALDLLAPVEAATRKAFTGNNAYRLARLLMNLGKARAGLGQWAPAAANLLEAQASFTATAGALLSDRRDCTRAIRDLYAAWDRAEPGQGYVAKAAEWQRQLDQLGGDSADHK